MGKLQLCQLVHRPHGDNPDPKTPARARPQPEPDQHKLVLTVEAQGDENDLCQQEQQGEESQAEGCPAPGQPHRLLRS